MAGNPAWLHAWVAPRAVCYTIDRQRSDDVLERLIGIGWAGAMTHDGFSSYDRFVKATHQQCLGHVLRRVRELEAMLALQEQKLHHLTRFAEQMQERDRRDSTRSDAPLAQAPDAIYLDSTSLDIDEVEEAILKIVRKRVTNGRDFS